MLLWPECFSHILQVVLQVQSLYLHSIAVEQLLPSIVQLALGCFDPPAGCSSTGSPNQSPFVDKFLTDTLPQMPDKAPCIIVSCDQGIIGSFVY